MALTTGQAHNYKLWETPDFSSPQVAEGHHEEEEAIDFEEDVVLSMETSYRWRCAPQEGTAQSPCGEPVEEYTEQSTTLLQGTSEFKPISGKLGNRSTICVWKPWLTLALEEAPT